MMGFTDPDIFARNLENERGTTYGRETTEIMGWIDGYGDGGPGREIGYGG